MEPRSLPWKPVAIGIVLIVILVASAVLLPKSNELAYQKPAPVEPVTPLPTPPPPAPAEVAPSPSPTAESSSTASTGPDVVVGAFSQNPIANATTIEGRARGNWFFEASFPIELRDENGAVLATAVAQAVGNWMTTDFVPFHATLHFTPPKSAKGSLLFKKDNPSGLAKNDKAIEVPVTMVTSDATASDAGLYLAFISEKDAAAKDCTHILSSARVIPKTPAIAKATIEELLGGPTIGEIGAGMLTIIPKGTKLNSLLIKNGVATVDFNDALTKSPAGSCTVGAIRAQITETLKQFASIQDVVISVNGTSDGILQP